MAVALKPEPTGLERDANDLLLIGPRLKQPSLWRLIADASAGAIAHALRGLSDYSDGELSETRGKARRAGKADVYEQCDAEIRRRRKSLKVITGAEAKRERRRGRRLWEAERGGWAPRARAG